MSGGVLLDTARAAAREHVGAKMNYANVLVHLDDLAEARTMRSEVVEGFWRNLDHNTPHVGGKTEFG